MTSTVILPDEIEISRYRARFITDDNEPEKTQQMKDLLISAEIRFCETPISVFVENDRPISPSVYIIGYSNPIGYKKFLADQDFHLSVLRKRQEEMDRKYESLASRVMGFLEASDDGIGLWSAIYL